MVGRGFQLRWKEETTWLHSFTNFGIYMQKKKVPETPSIEIKSIKIPGSHRTLKQEKTYGPRPMSIECGIYKSSRAETKRLLRELVYKLSREVVLRFDDKHDLIYFAELNQQLDVDEIMSAGIFTLSFICLDPFRYSVEKASPEGNMSLTLENNLDITYQATEFSNITTSKTLILQNVGTWKAQPIIEITGTCTLINITCNGVTTTYGPISAGETIYIDCKECTVTKKVNGDITNALLNWQGDFIWFESGLNDVRVTGTSLNISKLKFDYRHTFL